MNDIIDSTRSPEKPDIHKTPKDLSSLGKLIKIASFPVAGATGFWVMDSMARDKIMEVELKSSTKLSKEYDSYLKKRAVLSNAVDKGSMNAAEALAKREVNHNKWRTFLYDNLKQKGFGSFKTKFEHLRRVDKQKIIIESVTIGSIIVGAMFAVASSDIFKKQELHEGQSR